MSGNPRERAAGRGMRFLIGWWLLIVATVMFATTHLVRVWLNASSDDERMMFLLFASLQLLALVVLLVPYRRAESWAWWASWIPIVVMGACAVVFLTTLGVAYLWVAGVLAIAQAMTLPDFRRAAVHAR